MLRLAAAIGLWLALPLLQLDRSAPDPPSVFAELIGQWEGEGTLFGRPATFSMSWSWVLQRRFVRLEFENRLVTEPDRSTTVLTAIAYYRLADAQEPGGHWFDSRGQTLRLEPKVAESTLVTRWFGDTEQGRTTYRVIDSNAVEVLDEVLADGEWRRFGTASYRRSVSPAR